MTKRAVLPALLIALFLVPIASAHEAPSPRTFETRLMQDCIDDISQGHQNPPFGFEIHTLDIWEFWDGSNEQIGFRLVLNGEGEGGAEINFSFDLDGEPTQYGWTFLEGEWSAFGFESMQERHDVYRDDESDAVEDGDRFALVGVVKRSSIGGEGTVLSDFHVESDGSAQDDEMPGYGGSGDAEDNCGAAFERPDYTIGEKPVDEAYLSKVPDDMVLDLLADEERFIDVTMANRIDSLKQQVTMQIIEATGNATVDFHEPGGDYAKTVDMELNSRIDPDTGKPNSGSERLLHLALNAPGDASGSVTIRLITEVVLKDGSTQPGGHMVRTFEYAVAEDGAGLDTDTSSDGNEAGGEIKDAPAPAVVLASVALLGAAAWRRR